MARRRISHSEIVQWFAQRLRELRLSRNMTQAELARIANVPASYVSDLEKGKVAPGIDLLDRLARALDSAAADLLPPATPPETPEVLRKQVQELLEELLQTSDRDVLLSLRSWLTLLRELHTRRH